MPRPQPGLFRTKPVPIRVARDPLQLVRCGLRHRLAAANFCTKQLTASQSCTLHHVAMPRITLTLEAELLDHLVQHKPKRQSLSAFCADLIEQQSLGLDSASRLPAYRVGAGTQGIPGLPTSAVQVAGLNRPTTIDAANDLSTDKAVEDCDLENFDQALEPKKKGFLGIRKNDEADQLVSELLVTPRERGTNPKAKGTNPRAMGTNPRALETNPRAKRDPYSRRTLNPDLVPADLLDCQQLLPEFWATKKGTRSERVWNRVCNKLREWSPDQRREALERAIASGWGDVFEPPAARASSPQFGGGSAVPKTPQQLIVESVIRKHQEAEARRAAV